MTEQQTDDQLFLYQVSRDPKKTKKLMKIYADLRDTNFDLKAFVFIFSGVSFVVGLLIGYWAR